MDFRLFVSVLWRFKLIVALGFLIAVTLAGLSMVKVSGKGVTYRQSELWSSTTRLGVTQAGFPWGRLFAEQPSSGGQPLSSADQAAQLGIPIADPGRLNTLAVLYAELVTSDPVRAVMRRTGPIHGEIVASSLTAGDSRVMLPIIDLTAIATSPRAAVALALRGGNALSAYVEEQQTASRVPTTDRVVIQQLEQPSKAKVFQARPKTLPIVVFLAVMLATVGLAFLLQNLKPSARELDQPSEGELRRTA